MKCSILLKKELTVIFLNDDKPEMLSEIMYKVLNDTNMESETEKRCFIYKKKSIHGVE